jgi:hypothetical protein
MQLNTTDPFDWSQFFNEKYPDLMHYLCTQKPYSSDTWASILQDTPTPMINALLNFISNTPHHQVKQDIKPYAATKNYLITHHPEYTTEEIERRMEQTPAFILNDLERLVSPPFNHTPELPDLPKSFNYPDVYLYLLSHNYHVTPDSITSTMLQTPPIVLKTLNEFLHQNNDQTGFLHTH